MKLAFFEEAIHLNGLEGSLWINKALAHLGLSQWTKALQAVDHSLLVTGDNVNMLILRGKLLWKHGMKEEGNMDLKRVRMI